jgi:3-hydroxybutyryl-CoA dehydrogenase
MSGDLMKEVFMSESGLKTIGVIGIGVMGNGIAQVAAQSGFETVVMDVNEEVLEKGMANMSRSLDRLVKAYEKSGGEKGITEEAKQEVLGRLSTTSKLDDLVSCDLIIEAVPERPELKEQINRALAEAGYDKVLASNTSGISITRLGAAYGMPEKYMGMHFMNPVPMQKGVEIIRGLATSDETYELIVALCHDMGKIEIPAEDKAGFAINRMFVPFVNEAIRIVEEGIASVDDVDKCTYCLGHKMGPLMTADFVGLDTMVFICEVLEEEFGSFYKPSPLLKRLVESGQLGAKTGSGFYSWEKFKATGVNPDVARYRIK